MYAAGGIASGLGILLLVSPGGGQPGRPGPARAVLCRGRDLAVLGMQIQGPFPGVSRWGPSSRPVSLSAAFFATAVLARLLGQRLMANEELARRRGIELENQSRISQRVIERVLDGVLVVDRSGTVRRSNPVAVAMLA